MARYVVITTHTRVSEAFIVELGDEYANDESLTPNDIANLTDRDPDIEGSELLEVGVDEGFDTFDRTFRWVSNGASLGGEDSYCDDEAEPRYHIQPRKVQPA